MGKAWDVLHPRDLELGPLSRGEHGGEAGTWRNWKLARDDDGIAWLVLDKAGSSANTLNEEVLAELSDVLSRIEREQPKGVVLRSAKPSGFIAGADIGEFRGMTDVAFVVNRLNEAHAIVDRLDRLSVPVVAAIHGYCLGGGLELALACDVRVAEAGVTLGFPESARGLVAVGGGTQRAPRLLGPGRAAWLIMSAERITAARAEAWALVEFVVDNLDAGIDV